MPQLSRTAPVQKQADQANLSSCSASGYSKADSCTRCPGIRGHLLAAKACPIEHMHPSKAAGRQSSCGCCCCRADVETKDDQLNRLQSQIQIQGDELRLLRGSSGDGSPHAQVSSTVWPSAGQMLLSPGHTSRSLWTNPHDSQFSACALHATSAHARASVT